MRCDASVDSRVVRELVCLCQAAHAPCDCTVPLGRLPARLRRRRRGHLAPGRRSRRAGGGHRRRRGRNRGRERRRAGLPRRAGGLPRSMRRELHRLQRRRGALRVEPHVRALLRLRGRGARVLRVRRRRRAAGLLLVARRSVLGHRASVPVRGHRGELPRTESGVRRRSMPDVRGERDGPGDVWERRHVLRNHRSAVLSLAEPRAT